MDHREGAGGGAGGEGTGVVVFDDFILGAIRCEGVVVATDQRHDFAADAGYEVVFGACAGDNELLGGGDVVYSE